MGYASTLYAYFETLDSVTRSTVVLGVIAAAFGLGCLVVGLFDTWREWAKTHVHGRD